MNLTPVYIKIFFSANFNKRSHVTCVLDHRWYPGYRTGDRRASGLAELDRHCLWSESCQRRRGEPCSSTKRHYQSSIWQVVRAIKEKGGEATFIEADVSDQASVRNLHQRAVSIYGRLDGAVNNAGISTDSRVIGESSTEEFEKMWRVNVLGLFWCMQEQIAIMKKQSSGHIVNLASIAGLHGILYSGTYVATKHAVRKDYLERCL